jgi:RNA polymerase sigma factor (sigma-70 family)
MKVLEGPTRPNLAASDVQLVRAAREEDDHAFEELYRRYHDPIAGYVRRIVRDGGHAEEVAQETFLAALRGIRQTESEIQFKPWIYQIARNAAIDHYRRAGRVEEISFDSAGAGVAFDVIASTTPDASVLEAERFAHFRAALDELSDTQRRIIVLRELEGLSYREIAERMELSRAAVESALFRARRRLHAEYEQIHSGRRCAHIRSLMVRVVSGHDAGSARRKLERHVLRCWSCRRRARELGMEPAARSRRAMAFLPLPGFLRRLLPGADATASGARDAAAALNTPMLETVTQGVHKAAVVAAAALAIGGGGATLGGAGPLAVDSGQRSEETTRQAADPGSRSPLGAGTPSALERAAARRGRAGDGRPAAGQPTRGAPTPAARPAPLARAPSASAPSGAPAPATPVEHGVQTPAPDVKVPVLGNLREPAPPPLPALPRVPAVPQLPLDAPLGDTEVKGLLPGGVVETTGLPPLP